MNHPAKYADKKGESIMRYLTIILVLFWVFSCGQNNNTVKQKYLQKGAEIASLTQKELLKNVSSAMKKGGPEYAIEFCSLKALVLKDSLSKIYNCQIKRISNKYRNPVDMPRTETEKERLKKYDEAFSEGKPLQPSIYVLDNQIEYYKPILLAKDACLKCHGDPGSHISEAALAKIQERYPNDLAVGFALNDFRGAWKITFNKETAR